MNLPVGMKSVDFFNCTGLIGRAKSKGDKRWSEIFPEH